MKTPYSLYKNAISFMRLFGRTYKISLRQFHKLFSTYFHKFSNIAYKNRITKTIQHYVPYARLYNKGLFGLGLF